MAKKKLTSARYEPTIPLQEHIEKVDAERDQRYSDLNVERELRYQQLRAADAKALEAALAAAEKAVATALVAQEKAVAKQELAVEKRFEGANEFRQSLEDVTRNQVPRPEYITGLGSLNSKIDALTTIVSQNTGARVGSLDTRALIFSLFGIAGTVIGIVAVILNFR